MKEFLTIGCLLLMLPVFGQQEQKLITLEEAIRLARSQSLDAMMAKSVAGGVLAVQELQGGFVTECEVDGNDP